MLNFVLVIREPGRLAPDYSLNFTAAVLPRVGDYISVQRSDKPRPYGEDMIVRAVWWRLDHPETGTATTEPKAGSVNEIFVECEPAVGPYSSDQWRDMIAASGGPEFEVERFSVRESDIGR
ncbi:hypothetical protein [Sphingobium ummariense]|uniref:hypothetical protein n=1 Tax=Sphingobium ummariense TaxID=420994 RepID=UPI0004CF23EE|nr:hypothetical protein [Sphingobium ummariense]